MAILVALVILLLSPSIHKSHSLNFSFPSFNPNMNSIDFQGDAFSSNNVLQLTRNTKDDDLKSSVGRAMYKEPVRLWDESTGRVTDFITHFTFIMKAENQSMYGDGMSFFLSPIDSVIPANSSGGYLALFSPDTAQQTRNESQIVAVEFDSFRNTQWDPSADHVGININSIVSVNNVTWKSSIKSGSKATAWISYNSTTKNLSVFLTYAKNPVFSGNSSLYYIVDLKEYLPQWIRVGFSASTGDWVEIHNVLSWEFYSSLENINQTQPVTESKAKKSMDGLVVGLSIGSVISGCTLGWILLRWRRKHWKNEVHEFDDEFEKETGPKKFTFDELKRASNNFNESGKLGEGGFGCVYKGLLSKSQTEVAVKKVSRSSKQGKKEYVSEVKTISKLRHRNLVQLIGWCHEKGEFLLVYEFMPNGSLDSHLFKGKTVLFWQVRYKIVLGLASALLYLHEEWEQCVVHRDIKSSNVMLDSNYTAKLGDFGLARLIDHDLGSQTTVLAGTMGYLAPECVTTGKASKESDVYSFGVVVLEITCGRKPVGTKQELNKVRLVEWVWDLYGKGRLLEAADAKLNEEFDEQEMERLMTVGLWCCHPDYKHRPSIKHVINVLSFGAPLPSLPPTLPVPMYYAPPLKLCSFSHTSDFLTDPEKLRTKCTCSVCCTRSSSISSGADTN